MSDETPRPPASDEMILRSVSHAISGDHVSEVEASWPVVRDAVSLRSERDAALAEIARLQKLAGRFAYWLVDQGCRYEHDGRAECTYCGARIIGAGNDCEHKADCDYGLAIQAQKEKESK